MIAADARAKASGGSGNSQSPPSPLVSPPVAVEKKVSDSILSPNEGGNFEMDQ